MKKSCFTLIELLVVIGIIAILSGILLPTISGARGSAKTTDCLNNKKQISVGAQQYAQANNEMIPYKLDVKGTSKSKSGANYAYILNARVNKNSKGESQAGVTEYLPEKCLICNEATVQNFDDDDDAKIAVGMLNATSSKWYSADQIKIVGRFLRSKKSQYAYAMPMMTNPSGLLLFADTFKKGAQGETYWSFIPNGADSEAYVAGVHSDKTTGAFADGSAKAFSNNDLLETDSAFGSGSNKKFEMLNSELTDTMGK